MNLKISDRRATFPYIAATAAVQRLAAAPDRVELPRMRVMQLKLTQVSVLRRMPVMWRRQG